MTTTKTGPAALTSPSRAAHDNIFAALAAFQGEMPVVKKDERASVQGKDGRASFSYTYADLADIVRAVAPLLSRHGLAFTTYPVRTEGGAYELHGALVHTTQGRIEGTFPLFGSTPQQLGSAITYGRRYLLGCLTGVVTDDDDDAAAAQAAPAARPRTARDARADLARRARQMGWEDLSGVAHMYESDTGTPLADETHPGRIDQWAHQHLTPPPTAHDAEDEPATENGEQQ